MATIRVLNHFSFSVPCCMKMMMMMTSNLWRRSSQPNLLSFLIALRRVPMQFPVLLEAVRRFWAALDLGISFRSG
jgi:hypothetical protein